MTTKERLTLAQIKQGGVKTKGLTLYEIYNRLPRKERTDMKKFIADAIFVKDQSTVHRYINCEIDNINHQKAEAIAKLLKQPKEVLFPKLFN